MTTRILNFSGVYEHERLSAGAEDAFYGTGRAMLDFSSLGGTNCYCDPDAERTISQALEGFRQPCINWIDTGDYHYLSKILTDMIQEPFCLVLIDHHPDEQESAFGCLSCGNWVAEVKRSNAFLREVYSAGPKDKISTSRPDTHFLPETATASDMATRLPIYLSIDLDVLSTSDFRSDWDQGTMRLPHLERLISELKASHKILGIDICGGKTIEKGACDCELAANFRVRARLQNLVNPEK